MIDHPATPTNSASAHQDRFELRESRIDRVVVLSVCDTVDIVSAAQLTEAIRDALGKAPAGLIVDLTEVEFLASAGMSVLMAAQQVAKAISVQPSPGQDSTLSSSSFPPPQQLFLLLSSVSSS